MARKKRRLLETPEKEMNEWVHWVNWDQRVNNYKEKLRVTMGATDTAKLGRVWSCELKIALFKMRVYHKGRFAMENGWMKYVDGDETIIEELDSDRWSVYEAYYELEQLDYVDKSISSLWYKDPTTQEAEEFPEAGYTDVGPNEDGNNEGDETEMRLGDEGGTDGAADSGAKANTNYANDEEIGQGKQDGEDNQMGVDGASSDEDSDDGEYVPYASEVESVEDVLKIMFTSQTVKMNLMMIAGLRTSKVEMKCLGTLEKMVWLMRI
ncbi:hypothetical protein PIB30_046465 [Stylosanthes scabra]|uniref:PB1-like domain-containing protein n=1 Tax=Stylosanthes scabra TaxID=79078 RepID=A0ABU6SH62_9FABA|nr:hypothetical protein [Stylosanthes scabra]